MTLVNSPGSFVDQASHWPTDLLLALHSGLGEHPAAVVAFPQPAARPPIPRSPDQVPPTRTSGGFRHHRVPAVADEEMARRCQRGSQCESSKWQSAAWNRRGVRLIRDARGVHSTRELTCESGVANHLGRPGALIMTKNILQIVGGGILVAAGIDIYLVPPVTPGPLRMLGIVFLAAGVYLLIAGVRGMIKRQPGRS